TLYAPFESGLRSPTGTVYQHEIPGGQLSNLRVQATALGLEERFEEIEHAYARCDELLGHLVKVTPTSKVVGDLALYLVSSNIDPGDFEEDPADYDLPESVIGFLRGDIGEPPGGWPEPLRSEVLSQQDGAEETEDDSSEDGSSGDEQLPEEDREALAQAEPGQERRAALNRLLLPDPAAGKEEAEESYGDVSVIPTKPFFYGIEEGQELDLDLQPGVRLHVALEAISEADQRGLRALIVTVNGQARSVDAQDRSLEPETPATEKADPNEEGHVAAPMTGAVTLAVEEGEEVEEGQQLGTMEAMKMESAISAPVSGTVERIAVPSGTNVESGDLLLVLETS
ncbi:MAG TPA: biotin/lipoyl-containing protein, partial [Rubrobacteraceae bacterium]|nr:biotin/lipoyl-containing protein [Rubrobacteraceae bacterium]